jgi:hypothetical protein
VKQSQTNKQFADGDNKDATPGQDSMNPMSKRDEAVAALPKEAKKDDVVITMAEQTLQYTEG